MLVENNISEIGNSNQIMPRQSRFRPAFDTSFAIYASCWRNNGRELRRYIPN